MTAPESAPHLSAEQRLQPVLERQQIRLHHGGGEYVIFGEPNEASRTRLMDVYLRAWIEHDGTAAGTLALPAVVDAVHHAVSYGVMLEHMEEQTMGDVKHAVPAHLRTVLRALRDPVR